MLNLKKFKNNHLGMNIIEVVLVLALSLMIFIIVWNIYNITQKSYKNSTDREELVQNARIIMDRISREIRQTDDITTTLPIINDHSIHEIKFHNSHNDAQIEYIRYYLDSNELHREISHYYFSSAPETYVTWDMTEGGLPPQMHTDSDQLVGEFISQLDFSGSNGLVDIALILTNNNKQISLTYQVLSRNTRSIANP